MMGGVAAGGVADFYDKYFIGHWPVDTTIIPVCRTVGADRVVDEMIMSFTHDIPMPTFLPGVAPSGRAVLLPVVVVMGVLSRLGRCWTRTCQRIRCCGAVDYWGRRPSRR